jgi:hypothetical protein
MGDSINLGFHIIGAEGKKPNQLPKMKDPDRQYIAERLASANLPDEIRDELLRRLRDYPDGALHAYWDRLPDMIETLKIQRAKNEF